LCLRAGKVQDLLALFRGERGWNFLKIERSLLGVESEIELAQSREDFVNICEEGDRVTPVDKDVVYVELAVGLSRLCSTSCIGSRGRTRAVPWLL